MDTRLERIAVNIAQVNWLRMHTCSRLLGERVCVIWYLAAKYVITQQ